MTRHKPLARVASQLRVRVRHKISNPVVVRLVVLVTTLGKICKLSEIGLREVGDVKKVHALEAKIFLVVLKERGDLFEMRRVYATSALHHPAPTVDVVHRKVRTHLVEPRLDREVAITELKDWDFTLWGSRAFTAFMTVAQ